MDAALRKHCQSRRSMLLADRQPFEPEWKQVAEYIDPHAGRFLLRKPGERHKPVSRAKIINSAATRAVRTMDAGFMGGHTSKSRPWFRVTVPGELNELPDVRAWNDDVAQAIRDVLAKSNFYTTLPTFYHDRHLFGIGNMLAASDPAEVVRFYHRPIGTYAVGIDERGRVDRMTWDFERTANQIKAEFGEDNLPMTVRQALANGKGDQWFAIEALIESNPDARPGMQPAKFRPYRVLYWINGADAETHGCLKQDGVYDFNVLAGRWLTGSMDVYSPSPATEALGDIKQLQYLEGEKLRIIDLMSQPPLALPEALRNKGASLNPGARVYVTPQQTQQPVYPIYTPDARGLQQVQQEIEEVKSRIESAFFADLFRMLDFLDDRERTAFEISERKEEKVAMLSPALESLTDEVLDPVITLVYNLMGRAGLIPEPPEALVGQPVQIEYTSMLAQAQKAAGLATIERTIGFVGQMAAATQNPAVWDKVDLDQTIDEFHDRVGGPARIVRSDEAVAEIRGQREQKARMQEMAAMAPALKQGADAMSKLSETVPVEGSLAEGLAGAMGGA